MSGVREVKGTLRWTSINAYKIFKGDETGSDSCNDSSDIYRLGMHENENPCPKPKTENKVVQRDVMFPLFP